MTTHSNPEKVGEMSIEIGIAPPPERAWELRLTAEMKGMNPGESFLCDEMTAKAFRQFGYYHGWKTRAIKVVGRSVEYRVWRIS